ncbi:Pyruvate kinase [Candidatus Ornithobacterium hominis]|uniref:Pyruvate kinase n=1 Tax=Candidatus Ornithobacterium hominis TaxID=2497989 RepID=A0A383TZZ2_9FLAO|nr:Pyruvate kinase [Candidatus Ornithobacterium hominis]
MISLDEVDGPKLRIGNVAEGSELKPGDILKFTNDKVDGNKEVVYMTYTQFAQDVEVGERILIDEAA